MFNRKSISLALLFKETITIQSEGIYEGQSWSSVKGNSNNWVSGNSKVHGTGTDVNDDVFLMSVFPQ